MEDISASCVGTLAEIDCRHSQTSETMGLKHTSAGATCISAGRAQHRSSYPCSMLVESSYIGACAAQVDPVSSVVYYTHCVCFTLVLV